LILSKSKRRAKNLLRLLKVILLRHLQLVRKAKRQRRMLLLSLTMATRSTK